MVFCISAVDLNSLDAQLEKHLENMQARIMGRVGGRIDAAEERLKAHTGETKLLAGFRKAVIQEQKQKELKWADT
jgi:hypothetical protein